MLRIPNRRAVSGLSSLSTLANNTRPLKLPRGAFELRRHAGAGGAPGCPEVDQHGQVGVLRDCVEVRVEQFDRLIVQRRLAAATTHRAMGEPRGGHGIGRLAERASDVEAVRSHVAHVGAGGSSSRFASPLAAAGATGANVDACQTS